MPKRGRDEADGGEDGPGRRRRQRRVAAAAEEEEEGEEGLAEDLGLADDGSGADAEDEEGEDLFGEDYMRDYLVADDDSDVPDEAAELDDDADEGWIASDDETVSEISESGRAAVDALLDRRQVMQRRLQEERAHLRDGVYSDVSDSESFSVGGGDFEEEEEEGAEEDEGEGGARRRRRRAAGAAEDDDDYRGEAAYGDGDDDDEDDYGDENDRIYVEGDLDNMGFDWRRPQGELSEWLAQELPRRAIKNRIYNFYFNYTEGGARVYAEKVSAMTRENDASFQLSYNHLSRVYDSVLALWLVDLPDAMIELLEEAANYFVFKLFPHYKKVHAHIFVRVCDLPICDPIRDFRQLHMNVLVRVEGVVVRRSPVYPQMYAIKYDCGRCSYIIGPIFQRDEREQRVSQCPSCHSKGPFRVNMVLTEYRNHQTIMLQESPGKVPPGRLPRSLEVVLTNDLIDRAKPGEEVDITGIYRNNFDPLLNSRQGFPVFTTVLHANNVVRRTAELGSSRMPEDERELIQRLSRHPQIKRKLIRSIAPSIHGREDIKLGLLLSMLGGVPKDVGGGQSHRIRGDINVLMVGDPGCAKSQFLKFVEKTANRAVFTTGRGSTAVGLTASVNRDAVTGDFVLEGGALVIADRGCCLIDEFDKMSEMDRTSIHEAMEQQTISIAKGGIVTTLAARCCIIAAANPVGGRYDPSSSFDANVSLTSPILSRFDLLFVVRDQVNVELDEKLAAFICDSHTRNHPRSQQEARRREQERVEQASRLQAALEEAGGGGLSEGERQTYAEQLRELRASSDAAAREALEDTDPASDKPLPQALLRKYILYAKGNCHPRIANIDENTVARLYVELRQESMRGGIAITVRHMESVLRLSEAHARMHLREFVRDEDVTAAIALFLQCFIQTQKYSMRGAMEQRFRKYLDTATEPLPFIHHHIKVAVQALRQFERNLSGGIEPTTVSVPLSDLKHYTSSVSKEVLEAYFRSPEFTSEFRLVRDPATGVPLRVEQTIQT